MCGRVHACVHTEHTLVGGQSTFVKSTFLDVVNFISTWVLTKNGATCQCLISMKDFPFLYHLENEKYKIIGYR